MTEEEARKKAEQRTRRPDDGSWIMNPTEAYMQCFRDMTSGKQHGWGIKFDGELRSDTVGEYQFSSGYGNEVVLCFTDRTDAMDYIATILPTSAKIEIVPVKLIEVKEK